MDQEASLSDKKYVSSAPSEYQRDRIRDALRAYHMYGNDLGAKKHSWADVREAIHEYTGVAIGSSAYYGGERLRQFVFGVKKRGEIVYSLPQPFEAVVEFVTQPDLKLLTWNDLIEVTPSPVAALQLTAYFQEFTDMEPTIAVKQLEGHYVGIVQRPDHKAIHHLLLSFNAEHSLLEVSESYDVTDGAGEDAPPGTGPDGPEFISEVVNIGWAVVTPEDSLIFLMKNLATGRNHTYYAVSDIGAWQRQGVGVSPMYFIRHEYGFELPVPVYKSGRILQELAEQLYWFDDVEQVLPPLRRKRLSQSVVKDGE